MKKDLTKINKDQNEGDFCNNLKGKNKVYFYEIEKKLSKRKKIYHFNQWWTDLGWTQ